MASPEESYRTWLGVSQTIKTEASRAAKSGESGLTVNEQMEQLPVSVIWVIAGRLGR